MAGILESLSQMWSGLSGPRKLSLIATTVCSIALLISIIVFSSKPKLSLLYARLAPAEAGKVVDYLQSRGIPFELKDNGTTIMVPATKVYETRLDLAQEGVPRTGDTAGGVGFEIFDEPKFGMSDFMQKANYHRALQGELARTISQLEEVEQARVMIVVPEQRLFSKNKQSSKASVFLKLMPGTFLETRQIQAIRFLVANGVEGLEPSRVTIVDSSGNGLALDQQGETITNLTQSQIVARGRVEDHLREKAQSMLDLVLGPGQSVVRISAELDFDSIEQTSEKYDPDGAVIRSQTLDTENATSETTSSGAAAGIESNQATSEQTSGEVTKTNETKENTKSEFEINRTVETRHRSGGDIKKISVAVFINARKTGEGADAKVVPRTPQELKSLEEIVKNAVGYVNDGQRLDSIQVQETEFNDIFANIPAENAPVGIVAKADQYMPYISQAFLILLAVAVMMYFRNIVRSSYKSEGDGGREFADILERFETLQRQDEEDKARAMAEARTVSLLNVDEMSRIIRDNPNNTGQAIRQWLNNNN
ncbi:MAG: flagellar basal-body MS-ring/collar protein FliF [Verrucomicrobiota bacterium]